MLVRHEHNASQSHKRSELGLNALRLMGERHVMTGLGVYSVALLWDVHDFSDMRKHSKGIAEFLSATDAEMMGGSDHADKFAG
jgi:hypothetical protein